MESDIHAAGFGFANIGVGGQDMVNQIGVWVAHN